MTDQPRGLKEAAAKAGVSRDTLRRAIQRGELAAVMVAGKTGPQFHVEAQALQEWTSAREHSYPELEAEPQGQLELSPHAHYEQRLARIEDFQQDQSTAIVRLAQQQELLQSVQTWRARAESTRRKVGKLQQQVLTQTELAEVNRQQLEQFQQEHQQLLQKLEDQKTRVAWMEKRIPGWVRKMFGVG